MHPFVFQWLMDPHSWLCVTCLTPWPLWSGPHRKQSLIKLCCAMGWWEKVLGPPSGSSLHSANTPCRYDIYCAYVSVCACACGRVRVCVCSKDNAGERDIHHFLGSMILLEKHITWTQLSNAVRKGSHHESDHLSFLLELCCFIVLWVAL